MAEFNANVAGGWITTFTGKQFSFEHPNETMIDVRDIAHHLSLICHWNGACREFFSVAQHSCMVAKIAPWTIKRWALFHDAAEAYVGDMTRPLKALLPEYKVIETRVLQVIAEKFDLPWPVPVEIKQYDDMILKVESKLLMHPSEVLHDGRGTPVDIPDLPEPHRLPDLYRRPLVPHSAEVFFLRAFEQIFNDDNDI